MSFITYLIMLAITSGLIYAITQVFPNALSFDMDDPVASFIAGIVWPITLSALVWVIVFQLLKHYINHTTDE